VSSSLVYPGWVLLLGGNLEKVELESMSNVRGTHVDRCRYQDKMDKEEVRFAREKMQIMSPHSESIEEISQRRQSARREDFETLVERFV